MKKVFPENLFEKESLTKILESLVNEEKVKPFECVGTRDEIKLALAYAIMYFLNRDISLPFILKRAMSLIGDPKKVILKHRNILNSWGENNLNVEYSKLLKKAI